MCTFSETSFILFTLYPCKLLFWFILPPLRTIWQFDGLNAKRFYLLLYSIALRTLSLSPLVLYSKFYVFSTTNKNAKEHNRIYLRTNSTNIFFTTFDQKHFLGNILLIKPCMTHKNKIIKNANMAFFSRHIVYRGKTKWLNIPWKNTKIASIRASIQHTHLHS